MKKTLVFIFSMLFLAICAPGQAPQKMSYQAVIRDNTGHLVVSKQVGIRIEILQGTTSRYVETHSPTTNDYGLATIEIGGGTVVSGNFSSINWASGTYYLKTGTDPNGGTNYNDITSTSQLLSVPYALYAANSSGWSLNGNAGTTSSHFIGTTDNQPLVFKVNNLPAGKISNSGNNAFYGLGAGQANSSGGNNNAGLGYRALNLNVDGDYNVAVGAEALSKNISHFNTALGYQALTSNTTGHGNTATGKGAMFSNTDGMDNVALGFEALYSNTTGDFNTATGIYSLNKNISGEGNTASGQKSLYFNTTGSFNTSVGFEALYSNTTGLHNTASGYKAMYSNTEGYDNAASGNRALFSNTSGYLNSAFGQESLYANKTGSINTALGFRALYSNTEGIRNSATGHIALNFNTTGSYNTASGHAALYSNTTGGDNTAIGTAALYSNTTGSHNTGIGIDANVSSGNLSYATVIGRDAIVNASNKIRLGNTAVTVIEGQVGFSTPSDSRFKFNVTEEVVGLDFIKRLRPVSYQFDTRKFEEFLTQNMADSISRKHFEGVDFSESSQVIHTGFIAQEVEQAASDCGFTFDGVHIPVNSDDNYSIAYGQFVVPLVKAVQELAAENEQLKTENEQLKAEILLIKEKLGL